MDGRGPGLSALTADSANPSGITHHALPAGRNQEGPHRVSQAPGPEIWTLVPHSSALPGQWEGCQEPQEGETR